jgi:hypothetical protein
MKKVFGECVDCNVWGDAPKEYKENKYCMVCPNCKNNMKSFRAIDPMNDSLLFKNKVDIIEVRLLDK